MRDTRLLEVFMSFLAVEVCATYPLTRELRLGAGQKEILSRARGTNGFHVIYNNGLIVGGDASIRILLTTLNIRTKLTVAFSFLDKETSEFYLSDDSTAGIGFSRNVTELGQPYTQLEFRYLEFSPNKTYNVVNTSSLVFSYTAPRHVHVLEFVALHDSSFALLYNGGDLLRGPYLNAWGESSLLRVECSGKIEVHEYHHTYEPVVRLRTYKGIKELGGPGAVFKMEEGLTLPESVHLSGGAVIMLRGNLSSEDRNILQRANVTMDGKFLGSFYGSGMVDVTLKVFNKRLVILEHLDPLERLDRLGELGMLNDPKLLKFEMPGLIQIGPEFKPVNVAVHTGTRPVDLSKDYTMCS